MDDWHRRLAGHLVTSPAARDGAPIDLELAFGRVRGAIAFVLELARAHRAHASGGVAGDDIWVQLGDARLRVTLNRRDKAVLLRDLGDERRIQWSEAQGTLVDSDGAIADLEVVVREALETLADGWRKSPAAERLSVVPPQPDHEHEDETTRG